MTKEEWDELDLLSYGNARKESGENQNRFWTLLAKTRRETDHPEGFMGACSCQTCESLCK